MISCEIAVEFETMQQELEEIKQMVRDASTLEDLNHLHHKVGASEQEIEAAEQRISKLDRLVAWCAWEKFESQCSLEELQARQEWTAIMNVQNEYEAKYC
ncbi:hypothetical protein IQ268_09140 [Oculatella sp. LEGE 06141]|uniref:hypothetical protein n=1 Tax=Oculatella sp. LEGE 06141 TaxID=1828648 RepID=UPI00187EF824|nr:hypothetical protein [Oculatella sp. LEGE 06141]MBE9178724.1 hypothetical protein [Oculatella sp. LEGE 06141]